MLTHASILSLLPGWVPSSPTGSSRGLAPRSSWPPNLPHRPQCGPPRTRQRCVRAPKITIRDQIQAHAIDANCRSRCCQVGSTRLAFEHFDAIGRWREVESVCTPDPLKVICSVERWPMGDPSRIIRPRSFLVEDPENPGFGLHGAAATYALRRMITGMIWKILRRWWMLRMTCPSPARFDLRNHLLGFVRSAMRKAIV